MNFFSTVAQKPDGIPIILCDEADWAAKKLNDSIENQNEIYKFKGKGFQVFTETDEQGNLARVYAGTEFETDDPRNWVILFAKLATELPDKVYFIENIPEGRLYDAMLGWGLAHYRFSEFKSDSADLEPNVLQVDKDAPVKAINDALKAVFKGRDLINTPANLLTTVTLAKVVEDLAQDHAADFRITKGADLLLEGFPAIYEVGKGSPSPAALLDLTWGKETHPKVTLVGKGVVFDTGGNNLKPASGMRNMKKDMGGAAVAISLAQLIMDQELPVRLRLLVPTVENNPGWHGYRPGDIIKTRKGLNVEIENTDAEGRVILCDALALAVEEDPDLLIDFATLTGAARVALGEDLPACYAADNALMSELMEASEHVREPLWHMPIWEPYRKHLNSDVADMQNAANTPLAGSITASLYLWDFVKPYKNWIHIDMFGWRNTGMPGYPKGAASSALRAVFKFLENRYRD